MAKKNARKSGGAAGIKVIDEDLDDARDVHHEESNGSSLGSTAVATRPGRKPKAKPAGATSENFVVSDIKKAAAFVNSIGGLDKAIAVLQILKVAKEVQGS